MKRRKSKLKAGVRRWAGEGGGEEGWGLEEGKKEDKPWKPASILEKHESPFLPSCSIIAVLQLCDPHKKEIFLS